MNMRLQSKLAATKSQLRVLDALAETFIKAKQVLNICEILNCFIVNNNVIHNTLFHRQTVVLS